ncbi:MAG: hypothetical protein A2806_00305 [Candidatus Terrybacteria bacterium RIFCSPHIGHO2_01_FULL_48_17]|uniref:Response regulatory domain-containing protein n=1 Tax=Candidatus Terrybacteria bacterium RIFCSPHIGHO2_01_FULL_48_17 TaxID=1802362 RepID=A0A1G2PJW8_9BACT|nr:MAG: hypothetical protein A2806_00305 [Candidatus Terrybacteria bacterium RIFCSPHIGHO2_01_FULL_48_17]OHA53656.1 MAG: hypothetical protein A3A30_00625 [Candidatus Terrybacteria bacterium RIFCSPLOWO2_01_FULL_48_14]
MEQKHILVVEDELLHVEIYKVKLQEAGFSVAIAQNEEEVYGALKVKKPDLILLDILLPGKSGLEILEELRGNAEYAGIPVVMLTNYDDTQSRDKAAALGAQEYFVKANMTPTEIIRKVNEILGI